MLDIGFPEMLLVALVILLVFGPERLPEVLRTLGGWIGRARRSFTSLKVDIEREIGADEIRRELHNSRILEEARRVREDIERSGEGLRSTRQEMDDLLRQQMTDRPADADEGADNRGGSPDAGRSEVARDEPPAAPPEGEQKS